MMGFHLQKVNRVLVGLAIGALLSAGSELILPQAQAQVNYWSHSLAPHAGYGWVTHRYGQIKFRSGHANGRQGPGRGYLAISTFGKDEPIITSRFFKGFDGYSWWLVTSRWNGSSGWVRGDYVSIY